MTRTNPWLLVLLAAAGGVLVWALESGLTSGGGLTIIPSVPFGVTLLGLAVAVLAVAWPVRGYTAAVRKANETRGDTDASNDTAEREVARRRVDPFRATFAVAFAKAAALAGSIFAGGCAAVVIWLVTRTVVANSVPEAVFGLVAAVALLIAGLIAESWCVLPPTTGEPAAEAE